MKMFESCVDETFKEAGLTKSEAPEMWAECIQIMSGKMAILSATRGLSMKRIDAYEEQKRALVDDLIKLKAEGTLR